MPLPGEKTGVLMPSHPFICYLQVLKRIQSQDKDQLFRAENLIHGRHGAGGNFALACSGTISSTIRGDRLSLLEQAMGALHADYAR